MMEVAAAGPGRGGYTKVQRHRIGMGSSPVGGGMALIGAMVLRKSGSRPEAGRAELRISSTNGRWTNEKLNFAAYHDSPEASPTHMPQSQCLAVCWTRRKAIFLSENADPRQLDSPPWRRPDKEIQQVFFS